MTKYNLYNKIYALHTILAVGLCLASCSDNKGLQEKAPVNVKTITVTNTGSSNSNEYVGTVEEKSGTVLSFEVPGNITLLTADEGDQVTKGQLLGRISPTTLNDAHQSTLTALNQARDAYRRMKPLHEQKVISEMQWVDVESKLHQAEAAERIAREQLNHTSFSAPFSGVIAARYADKGMNVISGQQIYKLVDINNVDIKISVPENEIYHIQKGTTARITVKAADNAVLEGKVVEKGISANSLSHTYNVKIETENHAHRLMPGMVCSVSINGDSNQNGHITIPANCIKLDTDGSRFVWLDINGIAKQRTIVAGNFSGNDIEVISGLNNGDKVIAEGSQKVSDGMKIKAN